MIHCLHCGAETSNGLALCDMSLRAAETYLELLPVYFRNLARWRPGRAGSRPVPGSRVLYDGGEVGIGTGDRISDTLDETATALLTSARELAEARTFVRPLTLADAVLADDLPTELAEMLNDDQATLIAMLCIGFEHHLTSISTTDWCGEFVTLLGEHEAKLRRLTEVAVPGWYAGTCRREGCEVSTYVVPGLTWVTCGGCGTTTHVQAHIEVVLTEAREWVARPKALASAVVALVDTEQSVPRMYDRIRRWAADEAIKPIFRVERGYTWDVDAERMVVADLDAGAARYRLGEVLDLTLGRATRKEQIAANTPAAS